MGMLVLFGLMLLNFAISAGNAYSAGQVWGEVTGFTKVVTWSSLIMSVCGFLTVTAVICGFISLSAGWIDHRGLEALFSLNYLMIIFPVLGTGAIITIHSWIRAYKERDFGSIATAGYNTFAQGYNTFNAANGGVSSAFSNVTEFFTSGDDDDAKTAIGKVAVLLTLLVAMMLAAGLTYVFFKLGAKSNVAQLRYARQAQPAYR